MSVNRTVNAAFPGLRQKYALRQELLFTTDSIECIERMNASKKKMNYGVTGTQIPTSEKEK